MFRQTPAMNKTSSVSVHSETAAYSTGPCIKKPSQRCSMIHFMQRAHPEVRILVPLTGNERIHPSCLGQHTLTDYIGIPY